MLKDQQKNVNPINMVANVINVFAEIHNIKLIDCTNLQALEDNLSLKEIFTKLLCESKYNKELISLIHNIFKVALTGSDKVNLPTAVLFDILGDDICWSRFANFCEEMFTEIIAGRATKHLEKN